MRLIFLLCILAIRETQAAFKPCPEDSACLYHARCKTSSPKTDILLTTTISTEYGEWKTKHCSGQADRTAELFIRPLSNLQWNVTLEYTFDNVTIGIGKHVKVMGYQNEAFIKVGYWKNKTTIKTTSPKLNFPVVSLSGRNLVDMFAGVNVYYADSTMRYTSSKQPNLWAHVNEITPCDSSLVIDGCGDAEDSCTQLRVNKNDVSCTSEGKLWLTTGIKWQQLQKLSCEMQNISKKDERHWTGVTEVETLYHRAPIKVMCAVEDPSHCDPWFIADDCSEDGKNCTTLNVKRDSATCQEGNMWLKSNDPQWQKLKEVTCNMNTMTWIIANTDGKVEELLQRKEFRCAVEKPEDWIKPIDNLPNQANYILRIFAMPILLLYLSM